MEARNLPLWNSAGRNVTEGGILLGTGAAVKTEFFVKLALRCWAMANFVCHSSCRRDTCLFSDTAEDGRMVFGE